MSSSLLPIELGQYIADIEGCDFVGASDTGEVFVSFHGLDPATKEDVLETISNWPEVTEVTEVFSISRKEVQGLVEGLNKLLEQSTEEYVDVNRLPRSDTEAGGGAGEAIREFLESCDLHTGCSRPCGSDGTDSSQPEKSHVCKESCGKPSSRHDCGGCRP